MSQEIAYKSDNKEFDKYEIKLHMTLGLWH